MGYAKVDSGYFNGNITELNSYGSKGLPIDQICLSGDLIYEQEQRERQMQIGRGLARQGCGCGCGCGRGQEVAPAISPRIIPFPGCSRGRAFDVLNDFQYRNPVKDKAERLALKEAISDLAEAVVNNDSDEILEKWNDFKEAFKNTYEYKMLEAAGEGKVSEKEVSLLMAEKFKQATGVDIKKLIKENCCGNFMAGIRGKKSSDQIISEMFKKDEPSGACATRVTTAIGTGVVGGAGVGAIAVACGASGPIGWAVGLGVAALCGLSRLWAD